MINQDKEQKTNILRLASHMLALLVAVPLGLTRSFEHPTFVTHMSQMCLEITPLGCTARNLAADFINLHKQQDMISSSMTIKGRNTRYSPLQGYLSPCLLFQHLLQPNLCPHHHCCHQPHLACPVNLPLPLHLSLTRPT